MKWNTDHWDDPEVYRESIKTDKSGNTTTDKTEYEVLDVNPEKTYVDSDGVTMTYNYPQDLVVKSDGSDTRYLLTIDQDTGAVSSY